jgi:AbrB family looped-hinge helix DNA binding protein
MIGTQRKAQTHGEVEVTKTDMHRERAIEAAGELRVKNQITLPKPIADAVGARPGDRFIFWIDQDDGCDIHLRRLPQSYAGLLAGVYGTPEEAAAYLQEEREAWGE